MARNDKRRKARVNKDAMIIWLLIIIIFSLTIYILFSKIDSKDDITRKNFLITMQTAQARLSSYVSETLKDTFGLYTETEILSGKVIVEQTDDKKDDSKETEDEATDNLIKDNEGNALTGIIDIEKNYGNDENPVYKINKVDFQKVLNVSLDSFNGVEFYVSNGSIIKVDFEFSKPDWWNDDFDAYNIK